MLTSQLGGSVCTLPVNVRYVEVDAQGAVLNAWCLTDFDEVMTAVVFGAVNINRPATSDSVPGCGE